MATLTYVYEDRTAVLGPLSATADPHSYDLCAMHAQRLTAPQGWEVVRLEVDFTEVGPSPDDLMALAEAVRESGHTPADQPNQPLRVVEGTRYGHLRVIKGDD